MATDALLQQALHHHQAGRLDAAAALYQKILAVEPAHADSLNLLGVIATQTGEPTRAVELLRRAIGRR